MSLNAEDFPADGVSGVGAESVAGQTAGAKRQLHHLVLMKSHQAQFGSGRCHPILVADKRPLMPSDAPSFF